MKSIFVWGLNFKTAPVEERELLACTDKDLEHLLPKLKVLSEDLEFFLLSTCNRVEIYAYGTEEQLKSTVDTFLSFKGIHNKHKLKAFLKEGKEAVAHILRVASSLDSMVVGETQITSQFKQAFFMAKAFGTTGKILNRLFDFAMRTAKRVRTETGISKSAVSVSWVAVELSRKIFGNLHGIKVLLVGAGEMAELSAGYLKKLKADVYITNRTYSKAVELAQRLGGHALQFESFKDHLHEFDVLIFSTASKEYLLNPEDVKKAIKKRRYQPMFIIDISVPRNVNPEVNQVDEVFLYDIDDLKEIAQKNLFQRQKEKEKGEMIVWDEVEKFLRWLKLLDIEEQLKRLKESWREEEIRSPRVRRLIHRLMEEVKKNPEEAPKLLKIFMEEEADGNETRKLPYVHNRAYGA
ncbi:glutamyl-tRNA reductase [Thermocrinis minervae]|uniref:Glutamyl-tRNA reductase n=1 Tax=Thermocrinis minervae TaxID=381751 RepID=A0A1M6QY84_9AQUI|nr:glutamyl-tRNA reductase [Thermocrinis minervae]SHK25202.1 glutamyl-tRNA reductase [Thermocrinis minervae]